MGEQKRRTVAAVMIAVLTAVVVTAGFGGPTTRETLVKAQGATGTMPHGDTVQPVDWKLVEQAMGKSGALQSGNVYKFGFPRTDLQASVRGIPVKPTFATGTHLEFLQLDGHAMNDVAPASGGAAMVMGDLVLTEDEINPVLLRLQQGGIDVTGLHNHLLDTSPRFMHLHIQGHGDAVQLADTIHAALFLSKTPMTATTGAPPPDLGLDTAQLDQTLGYKGSANSGVYQISVPRAETITDSGMVLPNAMGMGTALNFQATTDGKVAITGDFSLLGSEVGPVSRRLGHMMLHTCWHSSRRNRTLHYST